MSLFRKAIQPARKLFSKQGQQNFFRKASAFGDNALQFSTSADRFGGKLQKLASKIEKPDLKLKGLNEAKEIVGGTLNTVGLTSRVVGDASRGVGKLLKGDVTGSVRSFRKLPSGVKNVLKEGREVYEDATSLGGKVASAYATKNPGALLV